MGKAGMAGMAGMGTHLEAVVQKALAQAIQPTFPMELMDYPACPVLN
jgi:hypothetical protein